MMTLADLVSDVANRTVNRTNGRKRCEHWVDGRQCGQLLSASNRSHANRPRCRRHDKLPVRSDGTYIHRFAR